MSAPARTRRYGWVAAAAGVALVAYVTLNTLHSHGVGARGLAAGTRIPPFAAPLVLGDLDGYVNVARRPGQGSAGNRPACEVRGPAILNSCQLAERGPFVLAFLATRGTRCTRELDRLQRLRGRHPGVQVAAIGIRGGRGALRDLVRRHGWTFPVAWDRDGILANLYGVAVCPLVTFVRAGGVVQATTVGELDDAALDRRLAALEGARRGA